MCNKIQSRYDSGVISDIISVTNRKLCEEDFLTRIERIAKRKPKGIILREKDLTRDEYKALAQEVMPICKKYDVPCILHSFVEVALELRAEAIHLPIEKLLSLSNEVKSQFQILGASCHSVEDACKAKEAGCSYIVAGHIFDTDCKKGMPGRGVTFLQEICESVDIPVYAIGGITPGNIGSVRNAGAAGACVMSGLMTCEEPGKYLAEYERYNETEFR